ncbi:serine/threonine-protein kinase [Amycolatopsis suaedae]|uniref:serine/threonine-protein kinase n=1 Tax=Amycolatopsis suaedae TaxID=2510978 RepID=UPI001F0E3027|nr:serine/threonine-protein kinase [Amycolatopsis suaedae]
MGAAGSQGALVGGRYRLDQPIGRGRGGIVWLAYDTRLHRTVAAKRMYLPPGQDEAQAERSRAVALQQGHDAMRVDHPCAITVHDVVRDGPDVWLTMEYVPSRNMVEFLAEHGTLTPEQAAFLGIQLGKALTAAHQAGVPHRNLQPGNVLLADDGGVKLTDIGISGWSDPAYRAPEVARGELPTSASDAYSLGATLFAAVEGVPPCGADGLQPQVPPKHTGALTGALLKLLRTEPGLRPTMADTIASLSAITEGNQQAFIPPTAPAMPRPHFPPPGQPGHPGYQGQPPQVHQPTAVGGQAPVPPRKQLDPQLVRRWILIALAVIVAVSVGIGVVEVFFLM